MANKRIKGITIKIGGDTTDLEGALKETEKMSRSASSELREVGYYLRNNGDSAVLWQQKQELLTKAIEESRKKVGILTEAQEQIEQKFKNKEIDDGQYRAFQRELENAKSQAKNLEGQLKDTELKLIDIKNAADDAGDDLRDLGNASEDAGEKAQDSADDGFTVLKGAIADLAADAIKSAVDGFKALASEGEAALNTLRTRTGATAEEMEQYSKVMSNLYANNFGEDKADLAESIAGVKQQLRELSPEELEKITERAILMRDTFGYDVAESIRAVKMLMDQFEISAEEAYTLIAQGSQNGLDKNGDLLDTLNEYSVHYKSLGYSAEQFFNSLLNGTEAGTFSVDKLGDAVKEFNIRQKEGADETVAAWASLGLVQVDNSESIKTTTKCIDDQCSKIEELEKKLKYAYIEQGNFNAESDELKKMKMSDSIAEWEQELSELQESLAVNEASLRNMQNAETDVKYTAEELMAAFNSGGDEAQKATDDIINALFALEDETLKNKLGVQLFGTMWEDLGKDGVSALMDVSGEADKTASTLEDINKVKYDDAGSQFEQLKRKMITEILEPAAKNLIPKIEDGTDWLVKTLPQILDAGKKMTPVIKGAGAAFAAWKLSGIAKEVGGLTKNIKGGGGLIGALTGLASANPFGAVAAGVGLVTTAIGIFKDKFKEAHDDTTEFIKEQDEYQEKCRESIDHIKDLKKAADENAVKVDIEYDDIRGKWDELQRLVDQNGKIKQGYEERVKYIVNELTDATGVEIELVDGQIQKYQELKTTIEQTIEKKRAQRLFETYSANEAELYQNRKDAQNEVYNKQKEVDEAYNEYTEARSKVSLYKKGYNVDGAEDIGPLQKQMDDAEKKYNSAKESLDAAKEIYFASDSELDRLMRAENLIAEGEFEKASRLLTEHNNEYQRVIADKNKSDEERRNAYNETLEKMNSDLELANKAAENGCKESSKKQMQTVADALAENVEVSLDGGMKSADVFGRSFKDTCKRLLDQGVDLSGLERIMKERGYDLGDTLGVCLRNGFESQIGTFGESVGNAVDSIVGKIQDAVNSSLSYGPQPEISFKIPNMFNGIFDNIPFFASGGFIPNGGEGIVAEAGPELIEIMNGGAKITPLTGSTRNTAVSSGKSTNITNYYTTVNANVSGKYDVERLAEDLESRRRAIESAKGLR